MTEPTLTEEEYGYSYRAHLTKGRTAVMNLSTILHIPVDHFNVVASLSAESVESIMQTLTPNTKNLKKDKYRDVKNFIFVQDFYMDAKDQQELLQQILTVVSGVERASFVFVIDLNLHAPSLLRNQIIMETFADVHLEFFMDDPSLPTVDSEDDPYAAYSDEECLMFVGLPNTCYYPKGRTHFTTEQCSTRKKRDKIRKKHPGAVCLFFGLDPSIDRLLKKYRKYCSDPDGFIPYVEKSDILTRMCPVEPLDEDEEYDNVSPFVVV